MKAIFRHYRPEEDFIKIRDFLVSSYDKVHHDNWTLTRWTFSRHFAQVMHDTIAQWEATVGIWEDDRGDIIGVVHSEGEEHGEAFIDLGIENMPEHILEEMFEYAENKLMLYKDGKQLIRMVIPDGDRLRESIVIRRGYHTTDWDETDSMISIEDRPVGKLPEGFTIKNGDQLSAAEKGLAHAKAFGYYGTEYDKKSSDAYTLLSQAPDYRADLDLYAISENGEIAAFCTMWYDKTNKTGFLEPVGTVPEYRRMGLACAVIGEGLNRIAGEGAERAFVGSKQEFYLAIGFKKTNKRNVWEKECFKRE